VGGLCLPEWLAKLVEECLQVVPRDDRLAVRLRDDGLPERAAERDGHVWVRFPETQQARHLVMVWAGHGVSRAASACSIAANRSSGLAAKPAVFPGMPKLDGYFR